MKQSASLVCSIYIFAGSLQAQQQVSYVDTIADLRALTPPTSPKPGIVIVEGYYSAGDGGGSNYRWDGRCNFHTITSVNLVNGGSGYSVGNILDVSGGNPINAARVQVISTSGSGSVTGIRGFLGASYSDTVPLGERPSTVFSPNPSTAGGATFSLVQGKSDDGGTVIAPGSDAYTGTGRWVNSKVQNHPTKRNVLQYGAVRLDDVYHPPASGFDSLNSINNAIASLPNSDYETVESPGAGGTGHIKKGSIYFPGGKQNSGYLVAGEINCSPELSVHGDGSTRGLIAFANGTAQSSEMFIIHYRYGSGSLGNANTTFNTDISGLAVDAANTSSNPYGSGILFLGCNGSSMNDVVASASLRGMVVVAKGVTLSRLSTGNVKLGPGLSVSGLEITGDYWDIEHVNTIASRSNSVLIPAVQFSGAYDVSVQEIATESSPLSVRFTNCGRINIGDIHANADQSANGVTDSGLVLFDGADDTISLTALDGPGLTYLVKDVSTGTIGSSQITRNYIYSPPSLRGSYYQQLNTYALFNSGNEGTFPSSSTIGNTYLGYTAITSLLSPLVWTNPNDALTTAQTLHTASIVSVLSGTTTLAPNRTFIVNLGSEAILILPTASVGDSIEIVGIAGGWKVTQTASQFILGFDSTNSQHSTSHSASGYIESMFPYSSVRMVCFDGSDWMITGQSVQGSVSWH